jgi:hypothetical protein
VAPGTRVALAIELRGSAPPPAVAVKKPEEGHPTAPAAPSRVDEILALNQKAVSAYARSDVKSARALLQEADRLAVASGYRDAMVRAQTQVRLGAVAIAGQRNPRVGRRYLAKAVAINPAVKLPDDLATPATRKALIREKTRIAHAKARGKKSLVRGKARRPHGRGLQRTL